MKPICTPGAAIQETGAEVLRLSTPAGAAGAYRLAQLDNYTSLPRRAFPYQPPLQLRLRARSSAETIPGTWGFGLWNDPFSLSLGLGGGVRRFPALPNAAWFFFASPPNYLSLRDDLPAQGNLAATFSAPHLPAVLLATGGMAFPLLLLPPVARLARRSARGVIRQDSAQLSLDPTQWHAYQIDWNPARVTFSVDGQPVLATAVAPRAPLGLAIWIDNQYAAFTPEGRVRYGTLATDEAHWIEISGVQMEVG